MNNIRLFAPKPRRIVSVTCLCGSVEALLTKTSASHSAFSLDEMSDKPLNESMVSDASCGEDSSAISQSMEDISNNNVAGMGASTDRIRSPSAPDATRQQRSASGVSLLFTHGMAN